MTAVLLLLLASLALLVGPALNVLGERSRRVRELVDGLAMVVIAGICLLVVLPHVVDQTGFVGLALAAAGVLLPTLAHRLGGGPRWTLVLVALGLATHLLLDGAVLSMQGESELLGWAVVAHRLPAGFAIALAVQGSRRSLWSAWGVAFAVILATVGGYLAGPTIVAWLPEMGAAGLEALVAGVLLHVAFVPHLRAEAGHNRRGDAYSSHSHHGSLAHDHEHPRHEHHGHDHGQGGNASARGWAAAGALIGALAMLGGALLGHGAVESSVPTFLQTFGVLVLESAPALLLGYALAGVVPFLLTPARTTALGRGGKLMQSLRGVAFGLPLPVCSCGVLPLYESLIRRGAPPAAAMAFFVATPEVGLDAVFLSVPLLGSSLTVARIVAAFAVAVLVALLVGGRSEAPSQTDSDANAPASDEPWAARIRAGVRFGFVEVFDHTMPWIALGLIIAAVAEPMLSHGAIASIPSVLQAPLAALVGVPVYVCASGATPVAALAIHKGLSTGAAIAFLIAGPATNVTTFGVLARLHGCRTAALFGVTVTVLAVLAGWTVDALGVRAEDVLEGHAPVHTHGSWIAWLSVGGLAILTIASLVRQGPRGALRQILEPIHTH